MKITSIKQAEILLSAYIPLVSSYGSDGMSLDRMWPILERLGNPQDKLKVIHIAGTSGKTSTTYFISEVLRANGRKVGSTVSPHIDSITERIQINGQSIRDKDFCNYLGEFIDLIEEVQHKPSYFELLIALALWVFVREDVDYAVVETGMGGLLDASNVLTRQDKVCVITDIGFDHMNVLGNTLPLIASQKAGIIHEHNQVFSYDQSGEIMSTLEGWSNEKHAKITAIGISISSSVTKFDSMPYFQQKNLNLAIEVVKYVCNRDEFEFTLSNFKPIVVPARMEVLKTVDKSGQIMILDGAHNSQKMETFVHSFKKLYPAQKATVLIALKEGKDFAPVIDCLSKIVNKLIITTFNTSQDLPARSQDPSLIQQYCKIIGIDSVICSDNESALNLLLKSEDKILIITGSFYLISQIRSLI